MANTSSSDALSVGTPPAVVRSPVTNHPRSELTRSAVANQRRRAKSACGRVCRLSLVHAKAYGTLPRPANAITCAYLRLQSAVAGHPLAGRVSLPTSTWLIHFRSASWDVQIIILHLSRCVGDYVQRERRSSTTTQFD